MPPIRFTCFITNCYFYKNYSIQKIYIAIIGFGAAAIGFIEESKHPSHEIHMYVAVGRSGHKRAKFIIKDYPEIVLDSTKVDTGIRFELPMRI